MDNNSLIKIIETVLAIVALIFIFVAGAAKSLSLITILTIITVVYLLLILILGLARRGDLFGTSYLPVECALGVLLLLYNIDQIYVGSTEGSLVVALILNIVNGCLFLVTTMF